MNTAIIVIILIFIVIINVYSFLKYWKRRRNKEKNEPSKLAYKRHLPGPRSSSSPAPKSKTANYNKYLTKYNSREDYREPTKKKDEVKSNF